MHCGGVAREHTAVRWGRVLKHAVRTHGGRCSKACWGDRERTGHSPKAARNGARSRRASQCTVAGWRGSILQYRGAVMPHRAQMPWWCGKCGQGLWGGWGSVVQRGGEYCGVLMGTNGRGGGCLRTVVGVAVIP